MVSAPFMRDNRRFHRRPVDLIATLIVDGGAAQSCRIKDLSIGGASIAIGALPLGVRVRLAFTLPSGERIDTAGTVMWSDRVGVGVRFDGLRARETWALGELLDALAAPAAAPARPGV
jgi:PilZ domain